MVLHDICRLKVLAPDNGACGQPADNCRLEFRGAKKRCELSTSRPYRVAV